MVTERQEFGKIEILPDGQIQLRNDTVIERDGLEIIRLPHRSVLEPVENPSHENLRLDSILKLLWTKEVVDEYNRRKAERLRNVDHN